MRKVIFSTGLALLVVTILVFGWKVAGASGLQVPPQAAVGTSFTYQGYLADGGVPAEGLYDFQFMLFDDPNTGAQVGTTLSKGDVDVVEGLFTVELDFGAVFDGTALWLEIGVRPGASTGGYSGLLPRQPLTPVPYASYAMHIPLAGSGTAETASHSDHNHWGASWAGTGTGLQITTSSPSNGLIVESPSTGIKGNSTGASGQVSGLYGTSSSTEGRGITGYASSSSGANYGVYGLSDSYEGIGVYGNGGTGIKGSGYTGVRGVATGGGVFDVLNYGVYGSTNSSLGYGGFFINTDGGALLAADNDSDPSDLVFRVSNVGNVFADGAFTGGGADFAELMAVEAGLMPADVVCMSKAGVASLCTGAYNATVIGVYSTDPGFIAGGNGEDQGADGKIPVAMLGVVPVKASAENGPIQIGDLLVTASLPGHAMRCEGVEACFGRVLGKALEPLDVDTGLIQVLVMLQ